MRSLIGDLNLRFLIPFFFAFFFFVIFALVANESPAIGLCDNRGSAESELIPMVRALSKATVINAIRSIR